MEKWVSIWLEELVCLGWGERLKNWSGGEGLCVVRPRGGERSLVKWMRLDNGI